MLSYGFKKLTLATLIALFLNHSPSFSCTTLLVTKGASKTGSMIIAHTDDDDLGDQRIVYVPAQDHPKGSKRSITPLPLLYPRYVGTERGPGYALLKNHPPTPVSGSIDQVEHTYAYFDANYAILNEHGLAIGETTCASKFQYKSNDKMIFDIAELSRIALERCKTAREAVLLIGGLAEKYGYFDWGELLILADNNEGWVFEISASPKAESALWVAKKVPDGEVFISANIFRIREVLRDDPDMLYSSNLFAVAEEEKWIKDGKLDWLPSVSPGEYNHPYYSLRRVWRAQTLFNPSLNLSPWVENGYTNVYPFSIKPEKKLTTRDVAACLRDYYQETPFDLSKGLAAGPFGCPYRYTGPYEPAVNTETPNPPPPIGAWERPISIYYCGYSYITELRPWLPPAIGAVTWISLDQPLTSCYIPFYAGVNDLPQGFQTGSTGTFSRKSPWWAFNSISNIAAFKFSYMIEDIKKKQSEIEENELKKQPELEQKAAKLFQKNPKAAKDLLTSYCNKNADAVVKKWWDLATYLFEKYTDGYVNKPKVYEEVGYPRSWLDQVGYKDGPLSYEKPPTTPDPLQD